MVRLIIFAESKGIKMANLFAKDNSANGGSVAIKSSLFWMDGDCVESTWDLLAKNKNDEARMARMFSKQVQYGCNTLTYIVFHAGDPECKCNPWVGNPSASDIMTGKAVIDLNECLRWQRVLAGIKRVYPTALLVPTMFCGDDAATTRNEAFHNIWLPSFIEFLWPFSSGFMLATEASKSMDVRLQERMVAIMREYMQANTRRTKLPVLPIGVHNQGTKIAGNADFLCYEFSWHPSRGNDFTPEQVVAEARHVVRSYPNYIWFQEINMNPEGMRARQQVRAIVDLAKSEPRLIGIPGPM